MTYSDTSRQKQPDLIDSLLVVRAGYQLEPVPTRLPRGDQTEQLTRGPMFCSAHSEVGGWWAGNMGGGDQGTRSAARLSFLLLCDFFEFVDYN